MKKRISLPKPVAQALKDTGLTVAAARKSKGLSQVELAERMGVTPVTVARIEQGEPGTSLGNAFKAMWVLDLPLWPSLDVEVSAEVRLLQNKGKLMGRRVGRRRARDDF